MRIKCHLHRPLLYCDFDVFLDSVTDGFNDSKKYMNSYQLFYFYDTFIIKVITVSISNISASAIDVFIYVYV